MEGNKTQGGRNRRSLKNLLVSPAGQVRLIFALPVAGLLLVDFLLWALWGVLDGRLEGARKGATADVSTMLGDLQDAADHIFRLGLGFTTVCIVVVAAFGLLISHRFYGPLVPILRSVRAMTGGDFRERIRLRKGDELQELAGALNELAEKLGPKQG